MSDDIIIVETTHRDYEKLRHQLIIVIIYELIFLFI